MCVCVLCEFTRLPLQVAIVALARCKSLAKSRSLAFELQRASERATRNSEKGVVGGGARAARKALSRAARSLKRRHSHKFVQLCLLGSRG